MRASLLVLSIVITAGAASLAAATTQRAFVSVTGSDTHTTSNCSVSLPCRTFGAAVGVTNADGEVIVLDSGGYGPVTITQGVTIQAPAGVYAGISVGVGLDGITINAPGATVVLRGLSVNGQGGNQGITMTSSSTTLRVERCTITNMGGNGLLGFSSGGRVHVSDTRVANNGAFGIDVNNLQLFEGERLNVANNNNYGIGLANTSVSSLRDSTVLENGLWGIGIEAQLATPVDATIERVAVLRNGSGGIEVSATSTGPAYVSVADAALMDNGASQPANGSFRVDAGASGKAEAAIERTVIQRGAGDAVLVNGTGGKASVSNSTLTSNIGYAFRNTGGGTFYTRQNNTIRGNFLLELTNQNLGPITPLSGG